MDELFVPYKTVLPSGLTIVTLHTGCKNLIGGEISFGAGAAHAAAITPHWLGLPHFIEHMLLFGASRHHETKAVSRLFTEKYNLLHNGWTSLVETRYFTGGETGHVLPSRHFWDALTVAADSIFFPRFDNYSIERERSRIVEERSRTQTQLAIDDMRFAMLMNGQEYMGLPVIGTLEQIQSYSYDDFVACHQRCYSLKNAVISLAGDINHQEAIEKVSHILNGASQQAANLPVLGPRSIQQGEFRRFTDGANEGYLEAQLHFAASNASRPDHYPTQLANAGLYEQVTHTLIEKYGLYAASVNYQNWGTQAGYIKLTVATGDRHKASSALAEAVEIMQSPKTHQAIADRHQALAEKQILSIEVVQSPVQGLATYMNTLCRINAPLRLFEEDVQGYRATTPDQVISVLEGLSHAPMFLNVRGHNDTLDAVPHIDIIDSWRSSPDRPGEKQRKFDPQPKA